MTALVLLSLCTFFCVQVADGPIETAMYLIVRNGLVRINNIFLVYS